MFDFIFLIREKIAYAKDAKVWISDVSPRLRDTLKRGWLASAQGEKEGTGADEDEESADETHHSFGRQDFAKFCGKGSRDNSTENESCDEG